MKSLITALCIGIFCASGAVAWADEDEEAPEELGGDRPYAVEQSSGELEQLSGPGEEAAEETAAAAAPAERPSYRQIQEDCKGDYVCTIQTRQQYYSPDEIREQTRQLKRR